MFIFSSAYLYCSPSVVQCLLISSSPLYPSGSNKTTDVACKRMLMYHSTDVFASLLWFGVCLCARACVCVCVYVRATIFSLKDKIPLDGFRE